MKLPRRNFLHLAAAAAALPAVSRIAWAQAYPSRRVRVIVPFAPAGTNDILARLIGQWLSERLGQQFVIDNRPGGGGNIGTEAVVRAPADGYTLLLAGSFNAVNAALYDKLNFNFIRDIAPVASIGGAPYVMVINPSLPAKTVPEFISYAKANPGNAFSLHKAIPPSFTLHKEKVPCPPRARKWPRCRRGQFLPDTQIYWSAEGAAFSFRYQDNSGLGESFRPLSSPASPERQLLSSFLHEAVHLRDDQPHDSLGRDRLRLLLGALC